MIFQSYSSLSTSCHFSYFRLFYLSSSHRISSFNSTLTSQHTQKNHKYKKILSACAITAISCSFECHLFPQGQLVFTIHQKLQGCTKYLPVVILNLCTTAILYRCFKLHEFYYTQGLNMALNARLTMFTSNCLEKHTELFLKVGNDTFTLDSILTWQDYISLYNYSRRVLRYTTVLKFLSEGHKPELRLYVEN